MLLNSKPQSAEQMRQRLLPHWQTLNECKPLSLLRVAVLLLSLLIMLPLLLSLSGCGWLSTKPPVEVLPPNKPVSPPALTTPLPSTTYSQSAADLLKSLKSVTGTSTTSKP